MPMSEKQKQILRFPYMPQYDAIICDGAVRSGKTSWMSLSFVLWAMGNFDGKNFAICSKSVGAAERNIIRPLLGIKYLRDNFSLRYSRSSHELIVSRGRRENRFYIFGGRDESSAALIQGLTLAGVLLDEVALMPRSFVEQALARCSIAGSKYWFNCNPEGPMHWIYTDWILKADEKKALHLHFTLDDNPGLPEQVKERYRRDYTGIFYKRFVLGLWVLSEGIIYDMLDQTENTYRPGEEPVDMRYRYRRTIACDYGTANPTVFLEIYDDEEDIRVDREYRWDSRQEYRQKTDEQYANDLIAFMGDDPCTVIVDPAAASFIAELRSRGVYVIPGDNEVLDGIRKTATLIQRREVKISTACEGLLREMAAYVWDDKASRRGEERPVKSMDHAPDALRYYINSLPAWRFE